jgi:hypothetical protein
MPSVTSWIEHERASNPYRWKQFVDPYIRRGWHVVNVDIGTMLPDRLTQRLNEWTGGGDRDKGTADWEFPIRNILVFKSLDKALMFKLLWPEWP